MAGDEDGRFLVVHQQHVAAENRQLAEELGHEARQGEVPATEEQHPDGFG